MLPTETNFSVFTFSRRIYPKRLTNENKQYSSETNSRTTICKCYDPSQFIL